MLLNRFQFLAPSSLVLCRELVIVSNRCISVKEEPRSSSVNLIVAMDVAMSDTGSDLPSVFALALPMLIVLWKRAATQCTMLQRS